MHLGSLIMIVHEILRATAGQPSRRRRVRRQRPVHRRQHASARHHRGLAGVRGRRSPSGSWPTSPTTPTAPAGETRSIWDEGLRIPPIRVVEAGTLREDVMELMLLNFHLPASGAATSAPSSRRTARRRPAARAAGAATGAPTCSAAMDALLAYGERKIRAALRRVPDGVYAFEDWMDDDGVGGPPVPLACTITVVDDPSRSISPAPGPRWRAISTSSIWPCGHGLLRAQGAARPRPSRPTAAFTAPSVSRPRGLHRQRPPPAPSRGGRRPASAWPT